MAPRVNVPRLPRSRSRGTFTESFRHGCKFDGVVIDFLLHVLQYFSGCSPLDKRICEASADVLSKKKKYK
jgi:hypothetical protein